MNSGPCKGQFAVVTIAAAPSALANVIIQWPVWATPTPIWRSS